MIRTGKQHLLKTFINHVTPTISAVSRQCRQWPVSDVRSMTTHISTANAIKYDFRSDTVTIPTADMRQAIASAEVGDDGYGDDPSVNSLEEHVASLCGKEKGLFMVSSTMCNQVAVSVNLHASQMLRQDVIVPEIIIDKRAHLFGRENGGLSLLSRAHTNTIDSGEYGGILTAEDITKNLHMHVDLHQPITSLICLESPNWAGRYMPCSEIKRIRAVIEGGEGKGSEKLPIRMHLDGTRLWNQCIDSGVSMKEVASHFDTVNVCLSKGLGAPIGGVLVGSSRAIDLAKQYRKAFGGAWRQAGMMAAAGRFAIDNHWERMHEDHRRAKRLAEGMQALGFELICEPQTNIVIVNSSSRAVDGEAIPSSGGCSSDGSGGDGVCLTRLASLLEADGILIKAKPAGTRLYTHLQIDDDGVHYLLARIEFHMRSILSKKYE